MSFFLDHLSYFSSLCAFLDNKSIPSLVREFLNILNCMIVAFMLKASIALAMNNFFSLFDYCSFSTFEIVFLAEIFQLI